MTAYLVVCIITAVINIWAATNDFSRPKWLLRTMKKVHVPESSLNGLGLLKVAGGVGLLVGIGLPIVGTAAAAGLVVFFLFAIAIHVRARDYTLGYGTPVAFLALAVASLVLELYARRPVAIQ